MIAPMEQPLTIMMLYSNWSIVPHMEVTIAALYTVFLGCAWKGLWSAWLNAGHTAGDFAFLMWACEIQYHSASDWAMCQATSAVCGKIDILMLHDELDGKPLLGVW